LFFILSERSGAAMEKLCVRCKERPMAYPSSSNHWCKICLEENRKARYDAKKVRDKNLQQNYNGFSSNDYDVLLSKQGGVCAACGTPPKRYLHVDHDHITGEVRGLLCNNCNAALGYLQDDPIVIGKLLRYILLYKGNE
jgi:hypothetical protein